MLFNKNVRNLKCEEKQVQTESLLHNLTERTLTADTYLRPDPTPQFQQLLLHRHKRSLSAIKAKRYEKREEGDIHKFQQ